MLSLADSMSKSKQLMIDLEELIERTKNLSWEDVSGLMKVNMDRARDFEALTLVDRLAS